MRRLATSAVIIAGIGCVLLLGLWGWSCRRGYIYRPMFTGGDQVCVNNGEIVYWDSSIVGSNPRWEDFDARADPMTGTWIANELGGSFKFRFAGLAFGRFLTGSAPVRHTVVVVPVWLVAVLPALPMLWRLWKHRRMKGAGFEVIQSKPSVDE